MATEIKRMGKIKIRKSPPAVNIRECRVARLFLRKNVPDVVLKAKVVDTESRKRHRLHTDTSEVKKCPDCGQENKFPGMDGPLQ